MAGDKEPANRIWERIYNGDKTATHCDARRADAAAEAARKIAAPSGAAI